MRSIMQLATSIMFFFTIGLILSGVGVSHVQAQLTTAMLGTYTGSTQCDGITGELEGPLLFGPGNQIILSQDATGLTLFTDGAYQGACTAAATGFIGASCRFVETGCEFGIDDFCEVLIARIGQIQDPDTGLSPVFFLAKSVYSIGFENSFGSCTWDYRLSQPGLLPQSPKSQSQGRRSRQIK